MSMDAFFCLRCFCTENHEKRVPPNKLQSIRTFQQGREYKKIRLLCRNQIAEILINREPDIYRFLLQTGLAVTCLSVDRKARVLKEKHDSICSFDYQRPHP